MQKRTITVEFDMDNDLDNRVYYAIKNLPAYYDGMDMSKSFVLFIDGLVTAVGECEERKAGCESLLQQMVGNHSWQ